MNMYPLNEINGKLDELKKDMDWAIDHLQQTWDTVTWLVGFAKKVEPKLDQIEIYADLIPGFQAVAADLKIENERLRNRLSNTAAPYGRITAINSQANPPIVKIQDTKGDEYEIHVPAFLFASASLQIGTIIKVEARLGNHTVRGRGTYVIFHATGIQVESHFGTVDEKSET